MRAGTYLDAQQQLVGKLVTSSVAGGELDLLLAPLTGPIVGCDLRVETPNHPVLDRADLRELDAQHLRALLPRNHSVHLPCALAASAAKADDPTFCFRAAREKILHDGSVPRLEGARRRIDAVAS